MLSCGSMKEDKIYKCQDYGSETQVISGCDCDHDEPYQGNQEQYCDFICCGKSMVRK